MFKLINIAFSLLLLTACQNVSDEESNNQFQVKDGKLLFNTNTLLSWSENTKPSCELCNLTTYSKRTPAGPMLFKEITNERGDLILLSIKKARHSFAVKTGSEQHSMRLKIVEKQLFVSLDQDDFLRLDKNEKGALNIANNNYFIKLDRLSFSKRQTQEKTPEQPSYAADIVIWFEQTVK